MYEAHVANAALRLIEGDITTLRVDAIVNAANAELAGGGGVDGAIHRAGGPEILAACRAIGGCPTGSAVITHAGNLDAHYVIHAVAPRYRGTARDAELLRGAYDAAMDLAARHEVRTIAFPSLGTGAYGYPIDEAAPIALRTVTARLRDASNPIEEVVFALFSRSDREAYARALASLAEREQ